MTLHQGQIYQDGTVTLRPALPDLIRQTPPAEDIRASVEHWLTQAEASASVYYFSVYESDALVGQILLHDIVNHEALIAYHLFQPALRGRGTGTKMLKLLKQYVVAETDLRRLIIITSRDNRASQRIAEKAGFQLAGAPREDPVNGVLYDWQPYRPDVPVIKSFFDPHALAGVIAHAYNLANVRIQLIKATMRDVYHVRSDQGEFVALVYRASQSAASIHEEVTLMNDLAAQGFAVIPAAKSVNEDYLVALTAPEGTRHLLLLPFAEGGISRKPDSEIIRRYGALLADFHTRTDKMTEPQSRPIYNAETLIVQSLNTLESGLADQPATLAELRQIANKLTPLLQSLPTARPAFGIIHGDVIPSNALISASGLLTLIDFDLFGLGWRTYDIASYVNEIHFWNMGETAVATFLDGYTSVRPLSADELQTLPPMRIARLIFSLYTAAANINTWGRSIYLSDRVVDAALASIRELSIDLGL